jgi:hypothetical protein
VTSASCAKHLVGTPQVIYAVESSANFSKRPEHIAENGPAKLFARPEGWRKITARRTLHSPLRCNQCSVQIEFNLLTR